MNKKFILSIVLFIIIGGGILIWQLWYSPVAPSILPACTQEAKICPDGSSVGRTGPNCEFAECPSEIVTLPKESPAINARFYYSSGVLSDEHVIDFGEANTFIYEDGRVFANQDSNGDIQIKQCESISLGKVKELIEFFDSPFLKGLSDQGKEVSSGGDNDWEIIINTSSISRRIVQSSDYTRIVEFNDYYNRIISWCSFEEKI